jgi:hypothetical protein
MFMQLVRMIIFTSDVKKLCDFYIKCFELVPLGTPDADWVELGAGACNIAFHRISEFSAVRDGWIKPVFGTADVAGEKARLESLGVEMSEIIEFGEIRLCDGRDPDGNWFQISSRGF